MTLPVLQALLLADHVYQDAGTNKHVICGVFGVLFLRANTTSKVERELSQATEIEPVSVPVAEVMQAGSPWVYISLTEVQGEKDFELRYVDLSDNRVFFTTGFKITNQNPLETIQLRVALPPLPTPHEGTFALELLCSNTLLGAHRVLVKKIDDSEE